MAKKGTKNTAIFFRGINNDVAKAAVITDHHGKTNDKRMAKTRVAIKLVILLFIGSRC